MKRMALLFSHRLTEAQEREARERWGVNQILPLPAPLQVKWSQVPPEGSFSPRWMEPIISWLQEQTSADDLVLIQGEFGAVYTMVSWCHRHQRIPLYATTERRFQSRKLPDGTVENRHLFQHVNFRPYPTDTEK